MTAARRLTGIIFSDLGRAASFMALDWVQQALHQTLGFRCFPATLNVRPEEAADARLWQAVRHESGGIFLPLADGHCRARLYRVEIRVLEDRATDKVNGAVLLPEVSGYPSDKIEVVAPVRLKDKLGVGDGDRLTLEFLN